jgi:hypothetical protein
MCFDQPRHNTFHFLHLPVAEVSSLMKNPPKSRNAYKDWAAISLALVAGMCAAEVLDVWQPTATAEIPLHASVQTQVESPTLALGSDAGKARWEKEK